MEENNILNEFNEPSYEPASTGQRFLNYLIDVIIFYVFIFIISIVAGVSLAASGAVTEGSSEEEVQSAMGGIGLLYLITFGIFFLYYSLFEGTKGKTIGKMVTRTKVIRDDGQPMTFGKAFLRTLCRLVPFEFISAFISGGQMWHDSWTGTRVVKDK